MPFRPAALGLLAVAALAGAEEPDLFTALDLPRRHYDSADVWDVSARWSADPSEAPVAWGQVNSFQSLLNRVTSDDERPRMTTAASGLMHDPDRWRYRETRSRDLYWRKSILELPSPDHIEAPYSGRTWMAQEKVRIPVPIALPTAEQLFVYGQFDGSGDSWNNQNTAIYGKTGVGVKWALVAKSELQVRYATLFSYADPSSAGRFQERAQPAVEVLARMPLIGTWEIEYFGAAVPAISRTDTDQLRQELRVALPLRGDNEFEFGARYRWDYLQEATPWSDRASLFVGLRFRH